MKLFSATSQNLPAILNIVSDAQSYLASLNIDQWQDGYPQQHIIENDISNQECFIVQNELNKTLGTAMFTRNKEPTYATIEGNWLTDDNAIYGVIHRMAVSNEFRNQGVAKFIFNACEQKLKTDMIKSMRIDTHEDNKGMQGLLNKLGYTYCGVIYLANGDKRLAYEKLIKN